MGVDQLDSAQADQGLQVFFCCNDSIISLVSKSKISRIQLVSIAMQTGLWSACL